MNYCKLVIVLRVRNAANRLVLKDHWDKICIYFSMVCMGGIGLVHDTHLQWSLQPS